MAGRAVLQYSSIKGVPMRRSNVKEDARVERQVLNLILNVYPELFTENELLREIATNPDQFGDQDAIARAVFDLSAVGLLHCCGPLILPTRAALRFHGLEQEDSPDESS
jgi:hypothetical protein